MKDHNYKKKIKGNKLGDLIPPSAFMYNVIQNTTVMNNKNVDIKITYKISLSIKCYIYCLREAEQKKTFLHGYKDSTEQKSIL